MSNHYYVKPASSLTLEIIEASPATKEALERQAKREGVSVAEYISNAVLAELELDEDSSWDERARSAEKEREEVAAG